MQVHEAPGDADRLIVTTAISHANAGQNAVVIGEDTDLLALLVGGLPANRDAFFLIPSRSGKARRVFDIKALQAGLQDLKSLVLLFYCMTGCDTTSALYMQGKIKSWKKLVASPKQLRDRLELFNCPAQDPEEITRTGEDFLLML